MQCVSECTHHQAGGESHYIRDGILHGPGLLVKVDVSEHHAVHQRSKQEVHMADKNHAETHLHERLGFLQAGTTHSWRAQGRREEKQVKALGRKKQCQLYYIMPVARWY